MKWGRQSLHQFEDLIRFHETVEPYDLARCDPRADCGWRQCMAGQDLIFLLLMSNCLIGQSLTEGIGEGDEVSIEYNPGDELGEPTACNRLRLHPCAS
jgi:hypothetical protein